MKRSNLLNLVLIILLVLITTTCQKESNLELVEQLNDNPIFMTLPEPVNQSTLKSASLYHPVVYKAEYTPTVESGEVGRTIYFKGVGNKQLEDDFVPFLSYLTDNTPDITYYIDENRATQDIPPSVSTAAIERAMATWDNVLCSDLGMTKIPFDDRPVGLLSEYYGFGGSWEYVADIVHVGWFPCEFWESFWGEGGCELVLAITFTVLWADGNGNLVDSDNNHKWDVAWREIYYNEDVLWDDGERYPKYDIETVALHETGHGLSQAHWGKAFRTLRNDKLHFSPIAVMFPGYTGIQTELYPTDIASHCSLWSNWPNYSHKNLVMK